ncbi:hypothetical protein EES38_05395 [Vibrio viridaestus]|uniref:Phage tail fibre protein N-terminal domain-containing protein n=1 Tax=Vibrio viridaestus TaxID=2487322 RepID=A0A3N9TIW0_9VIBR|nr:hypothetical protein EES38_05395 [Vibrio viridaestus]
MSLTAIPIEFEKYLQNKISVGQAPEMNEMIFAYLPDLDLATDIDRNSGLPDVTHWVHQQDIDQVGKLGDNALVYSVVIPGSVAEFTFNAIYLRDKNTANSCGMVVYKADETKEAGMASTKSLVQQYTGAAQIAGITVDAATWQIDYQARLLGIEEDIRLAWLDYYGHTAFISGYDVIQQADPTKFKITAGIAYVGGLRAVLENDVIQTLSTLPTSLYLDVVREGTVLSVWSNLVSVVTSETALSDYVDESNQQHYVAKIADISADGTVTDVRVKGGLDAHIADDNPHPQYALLQNMVGWILPFHMEGSVDGFLDLKGGEYSRTTDAILWAYAQSTELTIDQATKDADPETYAMYFGEGDGSTTFTLPNFHLGHYIHGTGPGDIHGSTLGDAIRNITGSTSGFHSPYNSSAESGSGVMGQSIESQLLNDILGQETGSNDVVLSVNIDASRTVPVADVNRPMTGNLSYKIHRGWK